MSDHAANEPDEEQLDTWLRTQLTAAVGPPDVDAMSDAQLETMLDAFGDEAYAPDQMERLLARFWIEVSQAESSSADKPANISVDKPAGELGSQRIVERDATVPTAVPTTVPATMPATPDSQPSTALQPPLPFASIPARTSGRRDGSASSPVDEFVDRAGRSAPGRNTAVRKTGVRRTAIRSVTSFFSEYTPLLCLAVAIVTGFFVASHWPTARRSELAIQRTGAAVSDPQLADVGHISGTVDCRFAASQQPVVQEQVKVGQRLELERGLLEITYDAGARIILQGPATYTVESAQGGFLSVGKLTAIVEDDGEDDVENDRRAESPSESSVPKFVLRTPSVTVNDLGTEFGVEVRPDSVTEVCVFRGEVETVSAADTRFAPVRQRLVAGEAVLCDATGGLPQRTTVQMLGAAPLPSPGEVSLATRDARQSHMLAPTGLVATAYHRVWDAQGNLFSLGDRRHAFQVASDGIFGRGEHDEGPRSSFDTLAAVDPQTDFAGLTYDRSVRIDRIKVFLGRQFGDGGSWRKPPRVFVLVNPVDSDRMPPEMNPVDWRDLPPLQLSYGKPFEIRADANPGEVLEFVLTGYPDEHRTGYGWAVGGAKGNGDAGYVSITELRAYGTDLELKNGERGTLVP